MDFDVYEITSIGLNIAWIRIQIDQRIDKVNPRIDQSLDRSAWWICRDHHRSAKFNLTWIYYCWCQKMLPKTKPCLCCQLWIILHRTRLAREKGTNEKDMKFKIIGSLLVITKSIAIFLSLGTKGFPALGSPMSSSASDIKPSCDCSVSISYCNCPLSFDACICPDKLRSGEEASHQHF